jgi:micrococcal nuclease
MGSPCRKSVFGVNVSRPPAKRRQRRREHGLVQRAWNVWMNDIRSRRSFLGRALSITVGVLLIAAVVLLIISFVTARSDLPVSPESAIITPATGHNHIGAGCAAALAGIAHPSTRVGARNGHQRRRWRYHRGVVERADRADSSDRRRYAGTSHPSRPVECFGREASAFTREVLRGQTVLLEDDPTQDNRDRFNRLLRFVWLPDGRLVNYEIIAQGYGFEYTFRTPHRYQAQFKAAERAARQAQIGLWAPETCNGERIAADAITPVARTTPTVAPEATPLPPSFDGCRTEPNAALAPNLPVAIVAIDKRAEVVTLRNVSTATVNLDGWTMCSMRGAQIHPGIGGTLAPGETRDFPRTGGGNIWTDSASDPGALYDAEGRLIAYWHD